HGDEHRASYVGAAPPATASAAMTEGARARTGRFGDALLVLAAALVGWQLVFEYVGDVALTPPWRTVEFAARFIATANFWGHAAATLAAFAWALAISAVLGVAGGLVLGFHRFSGEVAEPILAAL